MHATARKDARQAFVDVVHAQPTENELRYLLAEGLHDSTFGYGWHDDGVGSFNMGAIHATGGWTGDTFSYTDSHADGTRYEQVFRRYPDAVSGWRDLVHEFYVRRPEILAAARRNDVQGVATAMVRSNYAEGFGATEQERIEGWRKALADCLEEIDSVAPRLVVQAQSPTGTVLGTATVLEQDAPGALELFNQFGTPILIAYPNGFRFLRYTSEIMIPTRQFLPIEPLEQPAKGIGIVDALAWIGVLGVAGGIFYGAVGQPSKDLSHA